MLLEPMRLINVSILMPRAQLVVLVTLLPTTMDPICLILTSNLTQRIAMVNHKNLRLILKELLSEAKKFASYGKGGNRQPNSFESYGKDGSIIGSYFSGYRQNANGAANNFTSYGFLTRYPEEKFKNYGDTGNTIHSS